ncbi:hypothetical protein BD626DRAFT_569071 [Schizophyllum amplum]|uniref:HMG box domain-containing protein n=1 Tax=Schizophyllum amplum TaxID=97359 RepID=A0A550CG90_9AGAR|nr:hypothetical protein BD626DRAFT_569071 [Auriculariopsis ampla]
MSVTRFNSRARPSSQLLNRTVVKYEEVDMDIYVEYVPKGESRIGRGSDPEHIKRPANCFLVFRSYFLKQQSAGKLKQQEISMGAAEVWRSMSPADRLPFEREAARLAELHHIQHPNYKYRPQKRDKTRKGGRRMPPPTSPSVPSTPILSPPSSTSMRASSTSSKVAMVDWNSHGMHALPPSAHNAYMTPELKELERRRSYAPSPPANRDLSSVPWDSLGPDAYSQHAGSSSSYTPSNQMFARSERGQVQNGSMNVAGDASYNLPHRQQYFYDHNAQSYEYNAQAYYAAQAYPAPGAWNGMPQPSYDYAT